MKKNQKIIAIVSVVLFLIFIGVVIYQKRQEKKILQEKPIDPPDETDETTTPVQNDDYTLVNNASYQGIDSARR